MGDPNVNKRIRDALIKHVIDLHRYSNSVVRDITRLLAKADDDIITRLAVALNKLSDSGAGTEFNIRRLDQLLDGIRAVSTETYRQARRALDGELRDFSEVEVDHYLGTFDKLIPGDVAIRTPSFTQVYAAATAKPFQGRLLSEWFDGLSRRSQQRMRDTIANGFIQGRTVDELIREVRGTRAEGYADGILAMDRREAESIVRTAISHTASVARDEFYQANSDLISEQEWLSTLDTRTTPECQIRDGLHYTLDGTPVKHSIPWLGGPGVIHWGCRSTCIPIVKSAAALGLDLPPLERAALNGVAAGTTKYGAWLKDQAASVQDDVLGPKRAALFRAGKLPFDKFFNDKGSLLTLAELRDRNPRLEV